MTPSPSTLGGAPATHGASWRWLLLPAVVALASRGSALACGFAMDDAYNVVDNPEIRSLAAAWRAATHALAADQGDAWTAGLNAAYWRPVATLSWALDYAVWGLQPAAFHAVNVLLHALAAVLLAVTLRGLRLGPMAAALAASWWAAHPVHSETVTLVTYRTELLAGLCALAAMALAATRDDGGRPWMLASLLALGLGAKESAVSLPLLWGVVAWARWRQGSHAADPTDVGADRSALGPWLRARVPTLVAMALVAAGWGLARAQLVQPTAMPFFGALTPWQTLLSSVAILGKEASWLLLPWPLAPFWDQTMLRPVLSLAQAELWPGVAWLLLLALGLAAGRRQPLLAAAAAIWIVAKLPTSQLIPLPVGAAERFGYLASVGAALALALALARGLAPAAGGMTLGRRGLGVGALVVWISAMTLGSAARGLDFRDDDTLTAATVRDHPDGFSGWNLLGKRALARGDAPLAARAFDRAAAIVPDFAPNERLRAEAWRAAGDPARADDLEARLRGDAAR